jgi:hypothetical protein
MKQLVEVAGNCAALLVALLETKTALVGSPLVRVTIRAFHEALTICVGHASTMRLGQGHEVIRHPGRLLARNLKGVED